MSASTRASSAGAGEVVQRGARAPQLARRLLGALGLQRQLGERDVAAGELVGRAHAAPEVDGVLELPRAAAESPRARASSPRAKRREARSGAVAAASASSSSSSTAASAAARSASARCTRTDSSSPGARPRRSPGGSARRWRAARSRAAGSVAAVEGDLGEAELRGGVPCDALAELRRLRQAALAAAQLRQAQDALVDQRGRAAVERRARRPSSSASASSYRPRQIRTEA